MEELTWAPQVTDAHVGVSVLDGVVTLSGKVDSFAERVDAKKAALRVKGVTVVANDLTVRDGDRFEHTDSDIAGAIQHVLDWSTDVPRDVVQAEVRDRSVALTGTVKWNYQRTAAERLARGVIGVLRVDNQVELSPRVSGQDAAQLIKKALVRHALQDASAISVSTTGSEVTLTGHVSTWAEKIDAGHAAWASPHASAVHNRIAVRP